MPEDATLIRCQMPLAFDAGQAMAAEVEAEWSSVLRTARTGMLAVPSRCAQRLPHLTAHDVAEIDTEVREVLANIGHRIAALDGVACSTPDWVG